MQEQCSAICFPDISRKSETTSEGSSISRFARHLRLTFPLALLLVAALTGCGGSSGTPNFTLQIAPATISIAPGGAPQSVAIFASPTNGFSKAVAVTVGSLPAGITATPSTLSLTPGVLQQIVISASPTATTGNFTLTLTGTSESLTESASSALAVASPVGLTSATLSASLYDFGDNIVNNKVTQTVAIVTNTGTNALTMSPALSGDASFAIVQGNQSCSTSLAAGSSCNMVVSYDPTAASYPNEQNAVLNMGFSDVSAAIQQTIGITGTSGSLQAGQVTTTANPQVALYTMTLPFPGSVTVNFGTTTSYGQSTWEQSTDANAGQVSIFVAGMKASTAYHMDATVQFTNGVTVSDVDHSFTTGAVPAGGNLQLTTATTPGATPQPGLELVNTLSAVVVSDLSGNILWTYAPPMGSSGSIIDGVKQLPDGNMLMVVGSNSPQPLTTPVTADAINDIREVNLAGDTVKEISVADLNAELATATCGECNVTLQTFHHDVTPLPNGHWLVLANALMNLSSTTTPALTGQTTPLAVLGDVIVDLDQNLQPVWVWNEFNHLDVNRHPYMWPDWTHTNAIVYSPDDGNLLISIRHQNWVLKVDYANGTGAGDIIWKLGEGGSFTLENGTDPTDWQYAQHAPSFFSTNTTGVFSLGLMDNGDDRIFPAGVTCGTTGEPPCLYSTVPVFQINESAKTATLTFHQILDTERYNVWGGNAEQMANGDVEYDVCGTANSGSFVYEVTQTATPQTIWSMVDSQTNFYRAFRVPSLYPNVQW